MTRRIQAMVYETVSEHTCIELEIPDDLDLNDKDTVEAFLEEAFIEGNYKKNEFESAVYVDHREIGIENVKEIE